MQQAEVSPQHVIRTYVQKLSLSHFRNYQFASFEVDAGPVVLIGPNGAGKTNILEAISLLSPGRGLRRAVLADIDNVAENTPWAISAEICGLQGITTLGTGRSQENEDAADKRIVKIDGKVVRGQTELAKYFTAIWLTPEMDTLFIEGGTARRKFLDRLVYAFDTDHVSRVNTYDYAMRERNRLLQIGRSDPMWLSALEGKMAEHGIAIAVARADATDRLNNVMVCSEHSFPKAQLSLSGIVETALAENSALIAEEKFKEILLQNRGQDASIGRALAGIHRTHVEVMHNKKNMSAERCSTGEQKALLMSIILAQAKAGVAWYGKVPVLLFDEVASHLDSIHRNELFTVLSELGIQFWLTGTDREIFSGLKARFLHIENGIIKV